MSRITPSTLFHDVWPTHRRNQETGTRLCRVCNQDIVPPKHYYCSDRCAELAQAAVSWDYARRLTLRRDQGVCQFPGCGRAITWRARSTANTAEIHHILPVKKIWRLCWDLVYEWGYTEGNQERSTAFARLYTILHNDVNNLISYCPECHKTVHRSLSRKEKQNWKPPYSPPWSYWHNFWQYNEAIRYTYTLLDLWGKPDPLSN